VKDFGDIVAGVHEGTAGDLIQAGPAGGLQLEDAGYEAAKGIADGAGLGEGVQAGLDALVGGLDLGRLEGGPAHCPGVEQHAQGPDVHLVRVTLALHHLGGDVVGSATDCALALGVLLEAGG
jgi:hypothetical protein